MRSIRIPLSGSAASQQSPRQTSGIKRNFAVDAVVGMLSHFLYFRDHALSAEKVNISCHRILIIPDPDSIILRSIVPIFFLRRCSSHRAKKELVFQSALEAHSAVFEKDGALNFASETMPCRRQSIRYIGVGPRAITSIESQVYRFPLRRVGYRYEVLTTTRTFTFILLGSVRYPLPT